MTFVVKGQWLNCQIHQCDCMWCWFIILLVGTSFNYKIYWFNLVYKERYAIFHSQFNKHKHSCSYGKIT